MSFRVCKLAQYVLCLRSSFQHGVVCIGAHVPIVSHWWFLLGERNLEEPRFLEIGKWCKLWVNKEVGHANEFTCYLLCVGPSIGFREKFNKVEQITKCRRASGVHSNLCINTAHDVSWMHFTGFGVWAYFSLCWC